MVAPLTLLRLCGLAVCGLSAAFSAIELLGNRRPDRTAGSLLEILARGLGASVPVTAGIEILATAGFAYLFWRSTAGRELFRLRPGNRMRLWLEAAIGLGIGPELLTMTSFSAPLLMDRRQSVRFLAALVSLQIGGVAWQSWLTGSHPLFKLMDGGTTGMAMAMGITAATTVVAHCLTFSLGLFAASERERAWELARVNAELEATRQLEAETARMAERLSLSRELHDASGHYLAALSVNLRLMRHMETREQLRPKLEECLEVVQKLLTEVRDVVRDLRELQTIDLVAVMEAMRQGIPGLAIHLEIDPQFRSTDAKAANTLFRCTQEIVTNTLKHSGARNLWLRMEEGPDGYRVEARDDGFGVSEFRFGNGLTGMRERVQELGGNFEVSSRLGRGFQVKLNVPARMRAA